MAARAALALWAGLLTAFAPPVWPQEAAAPPLSAIGWLSQSVVVASGPPRALDPAVAGALPAVPVARGALPGEVSVLTLGSASLDAVGLLPPSRTGLPQQLWGSGRTDDILARIAALSPESLPALQSLLITLLLAEADPPADAGPTGRLLIGRIDKLLELGALDQAMAILQAAGDARHPELFRRAFDVALLTGAEDRACRRMMQTQGLSAALPARIFCLARGGDWQTAAVTLQTAVVLGQVEAQNADPLLRFLGIDEGEEPLAPPHPVTPLDLRIYEAIGAPLPILGLPLAFAHSDLDERTGWKSRLEAAERLSRAGVIGPNLLLGYYTLQKPAASGGVWDRVAAFQAFEAALGQGEPAAIAAALPPAYLAMQAAGLEVAFADLFARRLAPVPLTGAAADLSLRLALLSADFAALAEGRTSAEPRLAFALALAAGRALPPPAEGLESAVARGFAPVPLPPDMALMAREGRKGEMVLAASERILSGIQGQHGDLTVGLAALRGLGLDRTARRAALQVLLLDRRG